MTAPCKSWTLQAATTLSLVLGDLTETDADVLVNAANPGLLGGGGVDGAIHRAAGPELLAACRDIVRQYGPLPTGQAVITPGFALKARFVIHTVGPVWRGGGHDEEALLDSAYRQSLALAARHGLDSISFPAIGCGAYGYPPERAGPVALRALRQGSIDGRFATTRLFLYAERSWRAWTAMAEGLLGPADR